jgi:hypothetical protein
MDRLELGWVLTTAPIGRWSKPCATSALALSQCQRRDCKRQGVVRRSCNWLSCFFFWDVR